MEICYQEFVDASHDSLTWYDWLVCGALTVQGIPDSRSSAELAQYLLDHADDHVLPVIDLLAARLISGDTEFSGFPRWIDLSALLSRWMAGNLTAQGSRSFRMRAQRLHYAIQNLIDQGEDTETAQLVLHEERLQGNKPWDQLTFKDAHWWITSDEQNIHRQSSLSDVQHWRFGMPTQMDVLGDGRLAVGSLYTPGAWLTDGGSWEYFSHERPIVLVFIHDKNVLILDHDGYVRRVLDGHLVTRVPCRQIHFARYFDGILYCMDNSDFGHLTTYDVRLGKSCRHLTLPVMVCNDVTVTDSFIYMIDKQQGSVFKFDHNWHFIMRALKFGYGPNRLLDPVSLRGANGGLEVVSWLSGRLTRLEAF